MSGPSKGEGRAQATNGQAPNDFAERSPDRGKGATPGRRSGAWGWGVTAAACLVGGELAALSLALLEARAVAWGNVFGLVFLPAALVSAASFAGLRLLADESLPSFKRLLLTSTSRLRLVLLGPVSLLALVLIAGLGRGLLGAFADRPAAGGALLSLVAIGVLTFAAYLAEMAGMLLAQRFSGPSAWVSVVVFATTTGLGLFLLVALGKPSGGSHWLELFGVLKRDELNLRPVAGLALIGLAALSFGAFSRRGRRSVLVFAWGGGALLLSGLGAFGLVQALGQGPREATFIEREAGLSSAALRLAVRRLDRDGDGASPVLGGGDCDDANPSVGPAMIDVPGNGVDEDCSGQDAPRPMEEVAPSLDRAPEVTLPPSASVLLLTVDTLRYDLGYMRPDRPRLSPNLDALARRSTVYERAYSLASYTSKSLGPMLLGRYPSETLRTFEHFDRFDPSVPFVQERLKRAGIHTVSAQAYWYFHMKGYGLERGWDVLEHSAAPKTINIDGDSHVSGDDLAAVVIQQLRQLRDQERFFLWAHWVDPHSEYVRHPEFDFGGSSRERYDSEVAFVDDAIGRVLRTLEELSLDENTLVIFTSDHGEAFGEHGMIRHGFEVWEELVRVPFIVHVPGAPPKTITVPRSLIDVAPTILDAFDVAVGDSPDFIRGTSLLPEVLAPPQEKISRRPVLVDMPQGPFNQERRAFLSGDFKLITTGGRTIGLYDLSRDPEEKRDLSSEPEVTAEIEAEMREFVARLRPVAARR